MWSRDNRNSEFYGGSGGGGSRGAGGGGGGYGGVPIAIVKNLYHEHAAISRREQAEIHQWLSENECTLQGNNIPRPIFEFSESTFPQPITDLLYAHYQRPTVIQSISWPVALSGRDMISIAKTGSGKTLGFILPAIVHTLSQPSRRPGEGPSVLVMLPTRELAIQVEEVAREFCKIMSLELTCCYGGAPKGGQANDLRRGVDIVIATPGRLLDFLESGNTNMRRCSFLVLDEADRMLDMGFEPQIRKIIDQILPDRQSLMFSATWPREVRALAAAFQKDPIHLNVGSLELAANHNIEQHIEVIEEYTKNNKLFELLNGILEKDPKTKVLIFVGTKRTADTLTRAMRQDGWPTLSIHGDKEQREREWVLAEFKEARTPILIATDVAARGLDVDDIKFVINFDYPNNSEDYVHRIGRTGRRDKTGTAITFFTPENGPKARDLIKVLEEAKQDVPAELTKLANGGFYDNGGYRRGRGGGGGSFGRFGGTPANGANAYPMENRSNNGGGGGNYGGRAPMNSGNSGFRGASGRPDNRDGGFGGGNRNGGFGGGNRNGGFGGGRSGPVDNGNANAGWNSSAGAGDGWGSGGGGGW